MSQGPRDSDGAALVVAAPEQIALERIDRWHEAPAGMASVRPLRVGLCGTDLEIIRGTLDPEYVRYPVIIGHEWSGIVESTAGLFAAGDVVVVEGIVPCGHCANCRAGDTNLCDTYDEFGFTRNGAACPQVLAPVELIHRVDRAVGVDAAAMVEPASVVYRALRRVRPEPACRVLVIGAGTIGLLAVQLVRLWTPASVTVVDRRAEQAGLAAQAGADRFHTDADNIGSDFDLVIEAAGSPQAVVTAVQAARRGGTVALLGYPGSAASVAIPIEAVINADLRILGSFSYTSSTWREVVGLLNAGLFKPDFLITHRFALGEWQNALDTLKNGSGPRAKVMLELDR